MSFKIIYAGTPDFAATILHALIHSHHSVQAVYTQPDRPAGRGRKLTASAVKELALQHHLPIFQPLTLRDEEEQKKLKDLRADLMVVVAYGLLLPKAVLTAPRYGCINVHASLLPRWRGAAPIQRAILAGDPKTGITIMQMTEGLDTGPILFQEECPIRDHDTSHSLYHHLMHLGAKTLIHALDNLSLMKPKIQDDQLATYANKITKEEARIDWQQSAVELARKIRAFNPWPVAFFENVRVWEALALSTETDVEPGKIIAVSNQGIDVATKKGILRLLKLQLPGGKVLSVADVLNSGKKDFVVNKKLA